MTQQLSTHLKQTTQWLRVCPSTRTWSSVLTESEPDPLPPQNSDRTRTQTKFKWRPSQWHCLPVWLSEPASMTCLKINLFRTCSVSESASMVSSKSTSSMSVFDTVSLLQWRVWRLTSSEPVQSVSLLQWHSVLDTFSFLYTPCQYRAFALLEIWVVARVCCKL